MDTKNVQAVTEKCWLNGKDLAFRLAKAMSNNPEDVADIPIGYIVPLGGSVRNWGNPYEEFNDYFGAVLIKSVQCYIPEFYTLETRLCDHVNKQLMHEINTSIKEQFGDEWQLAIFDGVVDGRRDETMALKTAIEIAKAAIKQIEEGKFNRDILKMVMYPCESVATNLIKLIEKNSDSRENPAGKCEEVVYEMYCYDPFAGQMVMKTFSWDVGSYDIQMYKSANVNVPVAYVIKVAPVETPVDYLLGLKGIHGEVGCMSGIVQDNGFTASVVSIHNEGVNEPVQAVGLPRGYDLSNSFKAKYVSY